MDPRVQEGVSVSDFAVGFFMGWAFMVFFALVRMAGALKDIAEELRIARRRGY